MVTLPLANLAYKILTCLVPSLIHSPPPSLLPSGLFSPSLHLHHTLSGDPAPAITCGRRGMAGPLSGAGLMLTCDGGGIWIETDAGEVRLLLFSRVQLFVTP